MTRINNINWQVGDYAYINGNGPYHSKGDIVKVTHVNPKNIGTGQDGLYLRDYNGNVIPAYRVRRLGERFVEGMEVSYLSNPHEKVAQVLRNTGTHIDQYGGTYLVTYEPDPDERDEKIRALTDQPAEAREQMQRVENELKELS